MVELEPQGHIALLTIRRPEARNAVNAAVAQGLEAAIDQLEADENLWVGILTGEGPVFSAGADLKEIAAGNAAGLATPLGGFGGITRRERVKPIIAAVDGPALAGGCEIALACDMIVASKAAAFGLPEVKRSLVAAAGGLFRLPRALPPKIAMEVVLTGEPIGARRAYEVGLVNHVVEAGRARETAIAMAQRIIENAPLAVRAAKRIVNESADWPADEAFERQEHISGPIFDS
ncbi:MAG TPA: crotonase/enoyl-CoA hydratase family protein, partial [Acidimicrobiales bacterium]|nr:crotonase/enoyl-CoA hydratase family protein [Acidimicrobiales bacterium]